MSREANMLRPAPARVSQHVIDEMIEPATFPIAYLCHEQCKATAGIFQVDSEGDVKSLRWQSDEDFVDFDPNQGLAGLEEVAEKWLDTPRFNKVNYPGWGQHMSYR